MKTGEGELGPEMSSLGYPTSSPDGQQQKENKKDQMSKLFGEKVRVAGHFLELFIQSPLITGTRDIYDRKCNLLKVIFLVHCQNVGFLWPNGRLLTPALQVQIRPQF